MESLAHRCVFVIGEDSVRSRRFRKQMADWGIWSYHGDDVRARRSLLFCGPDHYSADALVVTFNTHDLSTYAGWRSFGDLKTEAIARHRSRRERRCALAALAMLDDVLRQNAIDRNDVFSVLSFLAQTKSRLLAVSLEDILGVMDQPNIPGTVNEHPNWRRRLPVSIDQMARPSRSLRSSRRRASARAPNCNAGGETPCRAASKIMG